MNYSIHRLTLDVGGQGIQTALSLRKGESGHRLEISLTDGGNVYRISPDCTAMFAARKADGAQILNDCRITDNRIIYDVTAQTTGVVGKAECEIRLSGSGDMLLIAPKFALFVEDTAIDEGEIESSCEYSALDTLIGRVEDAISSAVITEAEAYISAGTVPAVTVTQENTSDGKKLSFTFSGIKGDKGDKGNKGDKGDAGPSGIFIGSGSVPEGYHVKIDPDGDTDEIVEEAPNDGKQYARMNRAWAEIIVSGGGGTNDHNRLANRDADAQHPISAIVGLADALDGKQAAISDLSAIRTGAALGATALQNVPSTYRTAAAQDVIDGGQDAVIAGQQRQITALKNLLEGVAYSTEEDTTAAYSKTVPTGAQAVSINGFGGHSETADGEIISTEVTEIESRNQDETLLETFAVPQALRTAYPLHSAGTAYDEYDFEQKKYIKRVGAVDLGTLTWAIDTRYPNNQFYTEYLPVSNSIVLCGNYPFGTKVSGWDYNVNKTVNVATKYIIIVDNDFSSAAAFKSSMNGVMLYYELAEPVEYDITEYLPDGDGYNLLLTEPGGTLTFKQVEDAQLNVPQDLTWAVQQQNVSAVVVNGETKTPDSDGVVDIGTVLTQHQSLAAYRTSAQQDVIDNSKVDKVTGKGLSTNDFTTAYKDAVDANTTARHTHSNKSVLDGITSALVSAWSAASTWVTTNGSNVVSHLSDTVKHITAAERTAWNAKQSAINTSNKLPYAYLSDTPTIPTVPTNVSAFTNDAGYLTQHQSLSAYRTSAAQDAIDATKADKVLIKTAMDSVATVNTQYFLGTQNAVSITLPSNAEIGSQINAVWYNGATAATLTIQGSTGAPVLDPGYSPSANSRSEINALWDGTYWAVVTNEQAVTV